MEKECVPPNTGLRPGLERLPRGLWQYINKIDCPKLFISAVKLFFFPPAVGFLIVCWFPAELLDYKQRNNVSFKGFW